MTVPATVPGGPNVFGGSPVDRASERRRDGAWLAEAAAGADARWLLLAQLRVAMADADTPLALPGPVVAPLLRGRQELAIFLGLADGVPWFALDLDRAGDDARRELPLAGVAFEELRPLAARLDARDASLLAQARGLVAWHGTHRCCARCGAGTVSAEGGHLRRCTNLSCGASHFPRTDPAVIALVTHGDACLLANSPNWAPQQYSTLAGFVEPGESLEDALRREVREEVGVELAAIRYHSSQPWPFPASLMVGFVAEATGRTVRVDGEELRDARWFTREELAREVAAGRVRLSSPSSVAFRLIDEWRRGGPADRAPRL